MTRGREISLGIFLIVLIGSQGCAANPPVPTPSPSVTETSSAVGDGVLRIGTILPSSGTFGFIGAAQVAGVNLAIKDINEAGGVNGAPVEVVHRDSGDAPTTKAEESFADLATNAVDLVIGPSSSVLAERIIPLAEKAQIALISPAATFPNLTQSGNISVFFRTIPSYQVQGLALGEVLSEDGPIRAALVYVDDDLGRALDSTFSESIVANGSELVASIAVPPKSTDLSAIVKQLVDAKPDVVVMSSAYSAVALTKSLISQVIASGFGGSKLWLTTQNAGDYSQAFPAGTLKDVNGIIEGFQPDKVFTARLKQVAPTLTSYRYAAEAYDATVLAALAAVVSGDDDAIAIRTHLRDVSVGGIKCTSYSECLEVLVTQSDLDYDGISGAVNFDAVGEISPAFYGLYTFNSENKFVFAKGIVAG